MRARQVAPLTPLECAVPMSVLISILNCPVTTLESALTDPLQLTENKPTLSLLECALTTFSPATPLECALTKNTRGGGYSSDSVPRHSSLATTLKPFLFTFLRTPLRFSALTKISTLLFSSDSALCVKKHNRRGWGRRHLVD
jgi:hypothetical protein